MSQSEENIVKPVFFTVSAEPRRPRNSGRERSVDSAEVSTGIRGCC